MLLPGSQVSEMTNADIMTSQTNIEFSDERIGKYQNSWGDCKITEIDFKKTTVHSLIPDENNLH